ncbi:cytochrome P450 4c3-like [Battus philenor]|uniref:cytochrome P450 4c3-like n=1 Tax=Battus philenor TaxID=42288 RepID=UPI0035CEB1DC
MFLWLLCFILIILVYRFKRRNMYRLASAIPGPEQELPFIGVAHTLTGSTEDIMEKLQMYSYTVMKTNGILRGWLGHILYFLVTNPVDIEVVLKTCLEKDDLHRFLRKITGNGGIFAPVTIWRKRRKGLIPAFSPKVVETFVETFSKQSENLSLRLAERVGRGTFSSWPYLTAYTLDSICETTLGIKINAQVNPPFLIAMKSVLNLICERIFHLWLQPEWLYRLFPQYAKHEECRKILHDFTDEVIRNKRDEIIKKKSLQEKAEHGFDLGNYKKKSFLDLLITLSGDERGYTNEELREEMLTLIIAGTDTSAVAIGYTLKLLAKYPNVQEKLFHELQSVFGDSDRPINKEDLLNLKYLERVVKESLRLFPPAPFVIRKVLEDLYLPSGNVIPAGSGIVVSIWGVHRDPKYWGPDADCFDPDRFLPERYNLQHSCSYMPFSAGPRNCLGSQYALMSVKSALSAILRRYKIVGEEETGPVPHIKSKLDIMMKAVDDYKIELQKRDL